jgi:hypothetical protein
MKNNLEQIMTSDVKDIAISRVIDAMSKVDAVSQNQDDTYSLRFPRFVRFSDDLS